MTLKRRGFLSMLGGAFAAPLMPSMSIAAATKAAYPTTALHAALLHAKTRVNFSAHSLSRNLNVTLGQAEQIMSDMSARGILGPLQGSTPSGRWARSKIWKHPVTTMRANSETQSTNRKPAGQTDDAKAPWADMRPFLGHLQDICRSQGMALHPRCAAYV